MSLPKYSRVLLKISGESLATQDGFGIDVDCAQVIVDSIKQAIYENKTEIAIVIGGGNILRGGKAQFKQKINRNTADQMGMLATIINGLALRDILISAGVKAITLSAKNIEGVVDSANSLKAKEYLSAGYVVIFSGGTGNPFVTTDSAASLRAIEIDANALLKATTVDGVYDSDPNKNKNAKMFTKISFADVLSKELAVMDISAFVQCRDFDIPICVFNMKAENSISDVLQGGNVGTWVN
jgi:uridylate kinase